MASPRLDRRAAAGAAEDRAGGGAGTGVAAARRGRSDDPDRSVRGQGGAGPGDRPGRHLVICHSEKEKAAATFKHGYGYHPLLAWLDNSGEALAGMLRP